MTTYAADAQKHGNRRDARAGSERPKKTGSIQFRIGDDVRERIEKKAAIYDMNVSEYVRFLLVEDLRQEDFRQAKATPETETPRDGK